MIHSIVVSNPAQTDLNNIRNFTLNHWGDSKARDYLNQIKKHFLMLMHNPSFGLDRSIISPSLRSFGVGSHVIFYRNMDNCLQIIRILHHKQDPQRHLHSEV